MICLIIEDNDIIARNIQTACKQQGRVALHARDMTHAHRLIESTNPDVCVIDRMLPDGEWVDLIPLVKKNGSLAIMTTAKYQLQDKLTAFEWGADDYLVKPFDLPELIARIRVHTHHTQKKTIAIAGMIFDFDKKQTDGDLHLTSQERRLLALLRHGDIVQRTTILEDIWWDIRWHDSHLDVTIAKLRKKLGKETIVTIKGEGYRLVV